MLPLAPLMQGVRCVLIRAPTSFARSPRTTTICELWSRTPASVRRSSTSTSISRRGRVNPASRLAASSGAATGSAPSLLTRSKKSGSTRRGHRRSASPSRMNWTGGQDVGWGDLVGFIFEHPLHDLLRQGLFLCTGLVRGMSVRLRREGRGGGCCWGLRGFIGSWCSCR